MKMENNNLRKESLPGDRQGTSGAGAGRDSMRDTGGRVLRRRAPVVQETTAQSPPQTRIESRTPPRAPPAEGAAQELQPALTQAGLRRQRMKWTIVMNETIMRIFYKVTNLGQEVVGYRQQLHAEFCRVFPNVQVSEQRVADQYRVILRNNLVPETRLNRIKTEVEQEILSHLNVSNNNVTVMQPEQHIEARYYDQNLRQPQQENLEQDNNDLYNELSTEMARAMLEYEGTNPLGRPSLPKVNSSKKLGAVMSVVNTLILPRYVAESHTLECLHTVIYCAAIAVVRNLGIKVKTRQSPNSLRTEHRMPPWERRLIKKIEDLRKDIGLLSEHRNGVRTRKVEKRAEEIINKFRIHSQHDPANNTAQQCIDTLKQKLSLYSGRLRRYKSSNSRKNDNKLFEQAEKTFYRKINSSTENVNKPYPTKEQIEEFWGDQLSTKVPYNSKASWVNEERQISQGYNQMEHEPFTTEEVSKVLQELHNWKSPGPDGIQSFWFKKIWCAHERLTLLINDIMIDPQRMPAFLTQGITYLSPKDQNNTQDPSKYRPITCLPTLYKMITSCITQRIYKHCEINNIIAAQQKGCAKGTKGCKEQLVIDSVICNQAYTSKRNLYTAYIDYRKAFDSVPHQWLLDVLRLYKVNTNFVTLLEHVMSSWRTRIQLQTDTSNIETECISIRRGIFQGDSLSPLWFCLAMNPLSHRLNSTTYGFAIKSNNVEQTRLNHLLYMDDIKLLVSTRNQLEQMLKIVEEFSDDIGMQFGLDKCRILNMVRGQLQPGGYDLENGKSIVGMQEGELYKYLGIKQARRIDHQTMKTELTNVFVKRVRQVLKTNLNSRNLFKALNTYACSALSYSFGIINWSKTDVENLQRKVRTLLTKSRKHHPRSSIERTTLPRHLGGRGLLDIGYQLDKQITNLRSYFQNQAESSLLHRAVIEADDSTPLLLRQQEVLGYHKTDEEKMRIWMEKPLHGRHPNEVTQDYVDNAASNYWLTSGRMFPETEGFLLAIQDQVIPTRNYLKHIVRDPSVRNDRCRYGCQAQETIQHITGGCQAFAATQYKERHDSVAKILHQELARKMKLLQTDQIPYYKYVPESILENEQYKLYWDRSVLTDQPVAHNRPDLILVDKFSKQTTLVDVAIPNSNNLRCKHNEKIIKYRDLETQIKRQWRTDNVQTVPIIMSSTGAVPKNLLENVKRLGLGENLYQTMQKAVLLATARSVRKFMGDTPPFHVLGSDNMERTPTELNPFDI